jgi:hypothetical protein
MIIRRMNVRYIGAIGESSREAAGLLWAAAVAETEKGNPRAVARRSGTGMGVDSGGTFWHIIGPISRRHFGGLWKSMFND